MTYTDVIVLIVLVVLIWLLYLTALITELFKNKRKLEKQLDEVLEKTEYLLRESLKAKKIRDTVVKTDDVYNKTVEAMGDRIKALTETLNDTYQLAYKITEERKFLVEYAQICRTLEAANYKDLSDETRQQIKEIIQKHNKFLETQKEKRPSN